MCSDRLFSQLQVTEESQCPFELSAKDTTKYSVPML